VNQLQSSVNHDSNQEMTQKLEQALQELRSTSGDANQDLVNKQQANVNEAQGKVNAKQSEVNAMQQKVNEQQQQVNVEYRRRIQEIFQSAMSRGLAQQLM
jgi:peptidoglycan hydrolase CwlO-like protein